MAAAAEVAAAAVFRTNHNMVHRVSLRNTARNKTHRVAVLGNMASQLRVRVPGLLVVVVVVRVLERVPEQEPGPEPEPEPERTLVWAFQEAAWAFRAP